MPVNGTKTTHFVTHSSRCEPPVAHTLYFTFDSLNTFLLENSIRHRMEHEQLIYNLHSKVYFNPLSPDFFLLNHI